ncbi:hypothetical protein NC651_010142 [Populus alba x Populus x berolinensis]|nr:hypothetical protein NC651_010142 [Populus alba x Populus x berolinensis]
MLSFNESPEEETSLRDKPINDTSGVLSASVSWKSIDHPTNTMLLFATLGRMDRKTDHQEDKKILSFVGGKWNKSRHLVFWSLGTLTGLIDRARRLVASREGISTPNTPYLR